MEEKHYTPSLKEFRIEFQYERFIPNQDNAEDGNWVATEMTRYLILDNICDRILEKQIRVKYLDRSDIESLGFNHINDDVFSKSDGGLLPIYYIDAKHYINFVPKHYTRLAIRYQPYGQSARIVFDGKIKNISELKFILKAIGCE